MSRYLIIIIIITILPIITAEQTNTDNTRGRSLQKRLKFVKLAADINTQLTL